MNAISTISLAAETSAGNPQDITSLARRAGLPFLTTLSSGLTRIYARSKGEAERLDLYDLVWATRAVIVGDLPANRVQVDCRTVRYFYEFVSFPKGEADPVTCSIVADLGTDPEPGRLHLSLPGERQTTVVVVEDNHDVAELMQLLLETAGFRVVLAHTGRAGLLAAQRDVPDIITMDMDLPDTNGIAVFQMLRALHATEHIPVVFCSGRHDLEAQVTQLGASGCLRKPDDLNQLAQHLRRILAAT